LSTSGVSLGLLGPVELRRDGVVVPVGAAKKRMILAVLGLSGGEVVSADRLIDTVWGERPPPSAGKALQVYVSQLRDAAEPARHAPSVIISQAPGYALALPPQAVDVRVFERLWDEGRRLRASESPDTSADVLSRALALWRGPPLADLAYEEAFTQDVSRLEEMRWTCLEDRIDADLAAGRHADVIADLEDLTHRYPLRERARGLLMLAYYRSGRQSDALHAYRRMRATLVGELGLEPSRALAELERQILQQDPALDEAVARPVPRRAAGPASQTRTILAVGESVGSLTGLLQVASPLARATGAELVIVTVLPAPTAEEADALAAATRELSDRGARLEDEGVVARVAAFSTPTPGADLVKFAAHHDVAMILANGANTDDRWPATISELLSSAACDVVLSFPSRDPPAGAAILVPFGGGEHDWAALELAAHLARLRDAPLVITGAASEGGADASRMLAVASLIVQRTVGVIPEPVIVAPGAAGILDHARGAELIVVGVSARYGTEGLGHTRETIVREASVPVLAVRHGRRPGLLTPPERLTRFGWSLST
jgi:DNA-binding SARP family transcriptional activator/nucleotide-binding universal stress UspA family protein